MKLESSIEKTENGIIYVEETYDNGCVITQPKAVAAVIPASRVLSKWDFRSRFTFSERMAITASADVGVITIREDLTIAAEVDMDDPAVGLSLDYLISLKLLTAERKAEILA